MQTVEFLNDTYAYGAGMTDPGAIHIADLTGPQQVELFNLLGSNLGIDRSVKRFSDSKSAIRRLTERLEQYSAEIEAEAAGGVTIGADEIKKAAEPDTRPVVKKTKAKPAPKKTAKGETKRKRRIHMNFVAVGKAKPQCGRDTLRGRLCDALQGDGMTLDELTKVVEKWDKDKGQAGRARAMDRAYENLRVIHYYLNMSLVHDYEGTGKIKIVPNRKEEW